MEYKIYIVPHFHYDVAYCDTFEGYLKRSFANLIEMLNIMEKFPEYRFLIEQVILVKEFWDRFPEHRVRLKELASEDRIELAPGMFVMPDMNLINGESLIRQVEFGRRWSKNELGISPKTCWIADCWGHHAQLPQILKKCGYGYYAFSRAMRLDIIDRSEFYWQGLDGTAILTHWMPVGYDGFTFHGFTYKPMHEEVLEYETDGMTPEEFDLKRIADRLEKLSEHGAGRIILLPDGTDFGRPQLYAPRLVKEWNKRHPDKKIKFALAADAFGAWEKEKDEIPTVSGDFNPAFQGTYCSRIDIKQNNRFLENFIDIDERLSSCLSIAGIDRNRYDAKVDESIGLMLYNQFHDIICGSIIDEAYEDTLNKYDRARHIVNEAIASCMDNLFITDSSRKGKMALFAFNSMCKDRRDIASCQISFSQDGIKGIRMSDKDGREVPVQIAGTESVLRYDTPQNTKFHFIFPVELPALGYTAYKIELTTKENRPYPSSLKAQDETIENRFYKLKLSENGTIHSLVHKGSGLEFIDPEYPYFNDIVFQTDQGDFWEYYHAPVDGGLRIVRTYPDPYPLSQQSRGQEAVFSHQKPNGFKVIETGPVRLTVKIEGKIAFWATTWEYTQYIYLYDNIRRIDFKTEFIPAGKQYRIRVCFPTNIRNGRVLYEIPFGIQERPQGEYPAMNWIEYKDEDKGLCLLNRGIPGSNVTDRVLMLSLFRAVDMGPGKYECQSGYGIGKKQVFEYSLIPFVKGDEDYKPWLHGYEFNHPVVTRAGVLKKEVKPEKSLFSLTPDNVVLSCLRNLGDKILVRIYEAEGKGGEFELRFPSGFSSVYETNSLGENPVQVKLSGKSLRGMLKPFEIKTFLGYIILQ